MKRARVLVMVILLLWLLPAISGFTSPMSEWHTSNSNNDEYIYPISPWTTPEIWKTYTSHAEKFEALQIPVDILSSISTEGLVETCISYPLYPEFIYFDSLYNGIISLENNFNGLKELYQRKDAAMELVQFYLGINIKNLHNNHNFPQFQLSYLEFVLANQTIVDLMTSDERIILMRAVLNNTYERDSEERFSCEDVSKALLLGRALLKESTAFQEYLSNDLAFQTFILTGEQNAYRPVILEMRSFISTMDRIISEME